MAADRIREDLVLPPGSFAYVLDRTKGKVEVKVGPYKSGFSDSDESVVWNDEERTFEPVNRGEEIQTFTMAREGQYVVLHNPSADTKHPPEGNATDAVKLLIGRKTNIPGPITFPLWPGQVAETLDGHRLRNNQYLLVRVYDEQLAKENWKSAVVASSTEDGVAVAAADLKMGQLLVIKGIEVSFYIPPTGIEVLRDKNGYYVRDAVSLERLEYSILLDENGSKRFVRGPEVVFPEPTEIFIVGKDEEGNEVRKYRAFELTPTSGLYIKVIADYSENGVDYTAGDEIFVTGEDQAIYYPREEHSIITYGDGNKKHYAIAIPTGEGRYVLDRNNGHVDLVIGPRMFLPDPRTQVIVRRVLEDKIVDLLYPGNTEAKEVNQTRRFQAQRDANLSNSVSNWAYEAVGGGAPLYAAAASLSAEEVRPLVAREATSRDFRGESFKRGTTYTPPRQITLDTKYEGAVRIDIWSGYAILVTKKNGDRRVEVGPKTVLLAYDENISPLSLSTGKPKNSDKLFRTAYLKTNSNQVGDIIEVETRDLVKINIKVSYRVNFEGNPINFFNEENYVKLLTDRGRSRLRNLAKRHNIEQFHVNYIDIIRDSILGTRDGDLERPGMAFEENGMRVYDLEVLGFEIANKQIHQMLTRAQENALTGAIELSEAREDTSRQAQLEELKRTKIRQKDETALAESDSRMHTIELTRSEKLANEQAVQEITAESSKTTEAQLQIEWNMTNQRASMRKANDDVDVRRLQAETDEFVKRFAALGPSFVSVIQDMVDKGFVKDVVGSLGSTASVTGVSTADLFKKIFEGTALEKIFDNLAERPLSQRITRNGSGAEQH